MAHKRNELTLAISGEPVDTGLTAFRDGIAENLVRSTGVPDGLLGNRRESTLSKGLDARFEMDTVSDPVAWAKMLERLLADRRRDAENLLHCWGLDPAQIEKALAGFTLDHVLLVPEPTYYAAPALQERPYIKPLPPSITDRIIAVKDEMAGLRRFGTSAAYPHKRRDDA